MEKDAEGNYSLQVEQSPNNFAALEYSLDHQQIHQLLRPRENLDESMEMVDYMLTHHHHHHHLPPPPPPPPPPPQRQLSLDRLSFADVMHFADFGPKLALNQSKIPDEENYFLKLPPAAPPPPAVGNHDEGLDRFPVDEGPRDSENNSSVQHQRTEVPEAKNKRKRPRSSKTTEEVEIQRMTHIAVERNRRKQMNEHLRVLRSLMPSSYVQRGDQASIIGGAIEFVRELEQLLQCLESQKRRRMVGGEALRAAPPEAQAHLPPPFFPGADQMKALEYEAACGGGGGAAGEEAAESKSCLADVEVKLLGFDAMIKILSRRRPGQLLRTIAALEDLQLNILHTNITTIEQTVLYSFNVKITGEVRFSAEDIASSIQQIFSFINAGAI